MKAAFSSSDFSDCESFYSTRTHQSYTSKESLLESSENSTTRCQISVGNLEKPSADFSSKVNLSYDFSDPDICSSLGSSSSSSSLTLCSDNLPEKMAANDERLPENPQEVQTKKKKSRSFPFLGKKSSKSKEEDQTVGQEEMRGSQSSSEGSSSSSMTSNSQKSFSLKNTSQTGAKSKSEKTKRSKNPFERTLGSLRIKKSSKENKQPVNPPPAFDKEESEPTEQEKNPENTGNFENLQTNLEIGDLNSDHTENSSSSEIATESRHTSQENSELYKKSVAKDEDNTSKSLGFSMSDEEFSEPKISADPITVEKLDHLPSIEKSKDLLKETTWMTNEETLQNPEESRQSNDHSSDVGQQEVLSTHQEPVSQAESEQDKDCIPSTLNNETESKLNKEEPIVFDENDTPEEENRSIAARRVPLSRYLSLEYERLSNEPDDSLSIAQEMVQMESVQPYNDPKGMNPSIAPPKNGLDAIDEGKPENETPIEVTNPSSSVTRSTSSPVLAEQDHSFSETHELSSPNFSSGELTPRSMSRSLPETDSPSPTLPPHVTPKVTNSDGQSFILRQTQDKREHLFKILVIGELGTGKTSIIKRYVHQFFSQHYRATIGVDFALKILNWDENSIIRLQLWDIAGQERFGNMTRVYYKEAVGALLVFDVTRAQTFEAIAKWKNDLDSKVTLPDGSPVPTVLLANKCDQSKEGIVSSPSRMDDFCRERGFAGWFETSARENINIDEAARYLVSRILRSEWDGLLSGEQFEETVSLDTDSTEEKSKCSC